MRHPDDDPVLEDTEPARLETQTGTYAFTPAVTDENAIITLSPVPERVSAGSVGYGVTLRARSVPSGDYCWRDHHITPVETQVVRLTCWQDRGAD